VREALTDQSIIFNPKLCSVFNSNRFARRTIFPSLISSSFAKVLTAENHFQSLARIVSFASVNRSKKKKTYTGSSLPFGKVADFTKFCAVQLFPLFAKRNFPTSIHQGQKYAIHFPDKFRKNVQALQLLQQKEKEYVKLTQSIKELKVVIGHQMIR
jgi:hypothetical protein